jgi:hypothetical protein
METSATLTMAYGVMMAVKEAAVTRNLAVTEGEGEGPVAVTNVVVTWNRTWVAGEVVITLGRPSTCAPSRLILSMVSFKVKVIFIHQSVHHQQCHQEFFVVHILMGFFFSCNKSLPL